MLFYGAFIFHLAMYMIDLDLKYHGLRNACKRYLQMSSRATSRKVYFGIRSTFYSEVAKS
jgi:hypothetical protein